MVNVSRRVGSALGKNILNEMFGVTLNRMCNGHPYNEILR